jgi:hypothetical protein
MRFALIAAASALTLSCLAATADQRPPSPAPSADAVARAAANDKVPAQCDDSSQQNAADEAIVKGDLAAASKCAGPQGSRDKTPSEIRDDAERSEKKLEDAAVRAKRRTDEKVGN